MARRGSHGLAGNSVVSNTYLLTSDFILTVYITNITPPISDIDIAHVL